MSVLANPSEQQGLWVLQSHSGVQLQDAGRFGAAGAGLTLLAEEAEVAERLRESGAFVCRRTGRPGTKLPGPPFRGAVGAWIGDRLDKRFASAAAAMSSIDEAATLAMAATSSRSARSPLMPSPVLVATHDVARNAGFGKALQGVSANRRRLR